MSLVAPYQASLYLPAGAPADFTDPWLEIDTRALAANVGEVRRLTAETPIMAVVKANAYGHGAAGIALELRKLGITRFAVAKVAEALALRQCGIDGQILNLGPFSTQEASLLVANKIEQSIYNDSYEMLAAAARALGRRARVHIKVDTGLSRVGLPCEEAVAYLTQVAARPELEIAGTFTTLVEDPEFDRKQMGRFGAVLAAARARGVDPGLGHAASSAAVIQGDLPLLDMVRVGNGLYGFEPQTRVATHPILSLHTRVVRVRQLRPGDTIAYHRRGVVERDMLVATLPLGYSDGYPVQGVGQGAEALIGGRRHPLIVYMSANHVTVDVSSAPGTRIGDEVVVFGRQGDESITISEVARWAGSSEYKVASLMSPLLPRVYRA